MIKLTENELRQYHRQIILDDFGLESQEKLKNASVLVIGAGGLGCPILQYLVGAGIGKVGIVDFDVVDLSNLPRQILFTINDLGKNKALSAKEKLVFLNENVNILAYPNKFEGSVAEKIAEGYDILIDATDNFLSKYFINDICIKLNKPWVFGSLFKFEGQFSVFNFLNGPNYIDFYPDQPNDVDSLTCSKIGVINVLPGIIALFMANEVIKMITLLGDNLSGKLGIYNALNNTLNFYKIDIQSYKAVNLPFKKKMLEISISEIEKENHPYYLLDVREEWEFEDYNKGGVNIPLNDIPNKLERLNDFDNIVCCCSYGGKSKIAAKLIKDKYPLKTVYSIKNGIENC